jgi:DNA-binding winged helix-turn-helix (wHTH) protein
VAERFAFEEFVLDTGNRRLSNGERAVDVNGRYFDALVLLVRQPGQLVTKDRFLGEVWRGVPVTDEALTQCIRTLRRQLGDDAARPRFIETVPKHGYRFIAPVEARDDDARADPVAGDARSQWQEFVTSGAAGVAGGAVAGLLGGLVYGFAGASQPGGNALSVLVVLLCLSLLVAVIGAAGVSFAIATAAFAPNRSWLWLTTAGAGGGLVVGSLGRLLGLDGFSLLVGQSPGDITGGPEGLLLGAAVGFGAWLASHARSIGRGVVGAALCGGCAGLIISLLGGRMMFGSLDSVERQLSGSRLRLEQVSALFGESRFGPVTQIATAMLEGALFAACIVAAMQFAERRWPRRR